MPTVDRYSLEALELQSVRDRIAALAATAPGRARAAALAPCATIEEARELLARAGEAMRLHERGAAPGLASIEDLRPALEHLTQGGRPLEPDALARAARTLRALEALREHLKRLSATAPKLASLASAIPEMHALAEEIDRAVDARGEVMDAASEKLSSVRMRIRQIESDVDRVLAAVMARPDVRRAMNAPKASYRHHRPVLAVRAEFRQRVPGMLLDRSATGSTVYIEPAEVVELGDARAEAAVVEAREVTAVLLHLSKALLARRDAVALATEQAAQIDLELAKGAYAQSIRAVVPELHGGRRLRLAGACHPKLVEMVHDKKPGAPHSAVPLDVELGGEYDLLVVTGPNTGGKTVALKTIGLLTVMAQCGVPVPARSAELSFVDGVFVDVGDEQAISQSLSTFSSHMVRVVRALQHATRDSLVLLDEVGAGTDPAEGGAIGEAVLEHLLSRGVRTMATTHLGRLKELAYRLPRAENATVEFDPETLQPRYRLLVGIPGASQALAVAARVGMSKELLHAAELKLEKKDVRIEDAVAAIQTARAEADALRRRAEALEESAIRRGAELDERGKIIEQRSHVLAAEAQKTIDDAIGRLRTAVRRSLDALITTAPKPFDQRLRDFRDELERAIQDEPIERRRELFLGSLKKDDVIFVPKFRRRCPVRRIHREKRMVTVLVGDLPTDVRFDEVTWYEVL